MGRAARLPINAATINTRLCRKIYSNYTHVVARCFESTGSTLYTVSLCLFFVKVWQTSGV